MPYSFIQSIRYKLQNRVGRVKSADFRQSDMVLGQLLRFINESSILVAIRDELLARTSNLGVESKAEQIINGERVTGESEEECAAVGYYLIDRHVNGPFDLTLLGQSWGKSSRRESFDFGITMSVDPLYEYLDEHLHDEQALLYSLRQYKHRCEWFRGQSLRERIESDTQRGEAIAATDLYEFLHGEGVAFFIEPTSVSGIADFVSEQTGEHRVVADTKLFWPEKSKGKAYIIAGFNQVYTYLNDFNEPCGYLVIYRMCPEDINFLDLAGEGMFPSLTINNKSIFFVVVDLHSHGVPASKRGKLKTHDIAADELIDSVPAADGTDS